MMLYIYKNIQDHILNYIKLKICITNRNCHHTRNLIHSIIYFFIYNLLPKEQNKTYFHKLEQLLA